MKKLRNTNTGEISYFDEAELDNARKEGVKLVNKYKVMKDTDILEELEEME